MGSVVLIVNIAGVADESVSSYCCCCCWCCSSLLLLLLFVCINDDVFNKINSHDDCCHAKADVAFGGEEVVHVLHVGDVCGEPFVDVNVFVKGGIDELCEMLCVLREEIKCCILFCVEEPVVKSVLFFHELFIMCNCTAVFVKSCLDVVDWGKFGVDDHYFFLRGC